MNTNTKLRYLVELALLAAIVLLMNFTPLGFLKVGVVEITFIVVPIAVGAIILGPLAGAILGGLFGILSFIQCFGTSAFGAMLLSINPVYTFIMCVIPRIIMGWVPGLIFKAIKGKRETANIVAYPVASLSCALTNTILFVGSLMLFFGRSDYIIGLRGGASFFGFVVAFVGLNGLVEAITCAVLAAAIAKALDAALKHFAR